MKKNTYIDPETGWTVTRETGKKNSKGVEWVNESITDPATGATHKSIRRADSPERSIAAWVKDIARHREMAERSERKRKKKLHESYPELARGAEVPDGPLPIIKLHFAECFASWGICLPEDVVAERRRGKICQAGWAIWYLFGSDEKGEYLDYYCAHRMTNDGHVRIYEDGRSESLPAIDSFRESSSDLVEDARLKKEHHAEDLRIVEILEAKGFGIQGDEPGGVQIQRYQRLQEPEE